MRRFVGLLVAIGMGTGCFGFPEQASEPGTERVEGAARTPPTPCQLPHVAGIDFYDRESRACFWKSAALQKKELFIAAAWGGKNEYPAAEPNLRDATAAGMATAAYCLLNFDEPTWDGGYQVARALAAVGTERSGLSFMAIDAETASTFNNNLTRRSAPVVIQRIQEAVDAVRAAGLTPVIYTRKNFWTTYTGNTTSFSSSGVPLWDAAGDNVDDLCASGGVAWTGYGGWTQRAGHQFRLDVAMLGRNVDLNAFDPGLLTWPAATLSDQFTYVWSASNGRTLRQDGWGVRPDQPAPTKEAFVDDPTFGPDLLEVVGGELIHVDGRLATLPETVEFSAATRFPRRDTSSGLRFLWWGSSVNGFLELQNGTLLLIGRVIGPAGQQDMVVETFNSSDAVHSYRLTIDTTNRVTLYRDCSPTPIGSVDGTTAPGFNFNDIRLMAGPDAFFEHIAWKEGAALPP
jgi:hypothetical protein